MDSDADTKVCWPCIGGALNSYFNGLLDVTRRAIDLVKNFDIKTA